MIFSRNRLFCRRGNQILFYDLPFREPDMISASCRKFGACCVKRAGFLFCIACAILVTRSSLQAGTWSSDQSIHYDDLTRSFIYFKPEDLPDHAPVVFWLHMGGSNCWEIRDEDYGGRKDFPAIAEQEKFLLIAPNGCAPGGGNPGGMRQHWNDCRAEAPLVETYEDDVGFIAALIDWADVNFDIDPDRVYAAGFSNGGMMGYRLAVELADRIAAVAVFGANISATSECLPMNTPIPVFICNGQGDDRYMPWNGGCVNSDECKRDEVESAIFTRDWWIDYNGCRIEPYSTIYEDINESDGCTVTSDLYSDGENGVAVKFYTILNGGHVMPTIDHNYPENVLETFNYGNQNRDIVGAGHAWDFMSQFALPTQAPEPPPPSPEDDPEQDPGNDPEQDPGNDPEQDPGDVTEQDPGNVPEQDPVDVPEQDSGENPVEQNSTGGGGGCMLMDVLPAPFR